MKNCLLFLMLAMMATACVKDEDVIDTELLTYVNDFEEEARLRGIELDIQSLDVSIHLTDIREASILGQCWTFEDESRSIRIDADFWEILDERDREYLMFHELGHCVLEREHLNDEDQNGNCISIMQSGTGDCRKRYNENNRTELLDELFDI